MLEPDNPTNTTPTTEPDAVAPKKRAPRKRAAAKAAAPAKPVAPAPAAADAATEDTAAPAKAPRKRAARKVTPAAESAPAEPAAGAAEAPAAAASRPTRRRRTTSPTTTDVAAGAGSSAAAPEASSGADVAPALTAPSVVFMPPAETLEVTPARRRRRPSRASADSAAETPATAPPVEDGATPAADDIEEPDEVREAAAEEATGERRRRRRGRRGRGGRRDDEAVDSDDGPAEPASDVADDEGGDAPSETGEEKSSAPSRRRRRRRRAADGSEDPSLSEDDPADTVVHVRETRGGNGSPPGDGVRGVRGSTRLEAKRQRRREGRDTGRRRPPILTEAEFLARREAVDRVMAVRQLGDRTQIAVLEDGVLVEHYVTRASATSYVGNVYLGRVQNVLPSMEAAFVDIGKGRNGVLYAGEVNWDAAGLEGKSRAIENALSSGDAILVQVTKDPVGHKGARLTSQVSLPGRFLVYVPGGGMTGISRKLPDTERHRLKAILKKIVPEDAGVIIRTAAEGASEEELTSDVERLKAQWAEIQRKSAQPKSAPSLVYGEPDLAIRVVRDVFNEDFARLVVEGDQAWDTVSGYITDVAPDLHDRVSRFSGDGDVFHELRVDEQLQKALDRKVFLPSGGSLVIDRTEAMTVVDVNTGKFVGAGGNLEQTVTRNNLEAAEEIVRQLRLRDVGGIIVIDFIDMVLESNRDLVLRRLTECLGRDRTKHQVAEVTSLGLVQMTRKRVGEGLLEAFSETCPTCGGRGVLVQTEPIDNRRAEAAPADTGGRKGRRAARSNAAPEPDELPANDDQRRAAASAMAAIAAKREAADDVAAGEPFDDLVDSELPDRDPQTDIVDTLDIVVEADTETDAAGEQSAASSENGSGPAVDASAATQPTEAEPAAPPGGTDQAEADAAEVAPPKPPRRRGRRGATRPAGPPVPVG